MPRTRTQEETAQSTNPMKIDVSITATRNYHESPERARATVTLGDCFVRLSGRRA